MGLAQRLRSLLSTFRENRERRPAELKPAVARQQRRQHFQQDSSRKQYANSLWVQSFTGSRGGGALDGPVEGCKSPVCHAERRSMEHRTATLTVESDGVHARLRGYQRNASFDPS